MALNKLENDILKLVDNNKIDILKVEELFKQGANPNALECDEADKGFNDDIYWSTLFSECIFASQDKHPNLYPILELFIKYGLDADKYGASIISDFHFIHEGSDIYEMTKLMLDNMDKNTDVGEALSGIGTEESYLNCSFDDMDYESNDLFGLCVLIESFEKHEPYKSFYRLPKIIDEKFKGIQLNGDFILLGKNKVAVKSEKNKICMFSKIEMEKNTLIVEDNYGVYINNEDIHEYTNNDFTKYANEYFKDEKILDLKFKHYEVKLSPKSFAQGRVVTINFSNNKKLIYEEDIENNLETLEIV